MLSLSRIYGGMRSRCAATITALCLVSLAGFAWAQDEAFELAPNNSDVVAVVQVAKILASPAFKKIAAEFPDVAKNIDQPLGKKSKLTPRNIESIFVAGNTTNQEFVVVLNLTEEFELNDVIDAAQRAEPSKIGEYTLYAIEDDQAVCLVDEQTLAIGPKKALAAVLKRNDEAELSDELTAAWENVDDEQHVYVVATLGTLVQKKADIIPPGLPLSPAVLGKLKSATITANAGQKQITFSANLNCTDNATANQLKGLLDIVVQGALQQDADTPAEAKQALKTVKSSTEDESLTIGFNVGLDVLFAQLKSQILDAESAE